MPTVGGYEWLILIGVLLLVMLPFVVKRLPDMARSVGQSARVFKAEIKELKDVDGSISPSSNTNSKEV